MESTFVFCGVLKLRAIAKVGGKKAQIIKVAIASNTLCDSFCYTIGICFLQWEMHHALIRVEI